MVRAMRMVRPPEVCWAAVDATRTGFYSGHMDRRRFLQWSWQLGAVTVGLGAGLAKSGAPASGSLRRPEDPLSAPAAEVCGLRLFRSDHKGLAPGVQLDLQLDGVAPAGWSLHWQIEHAGQVYQRPAATAADARWLSPQRAQLSCCVPYPFEDLVPGTYHVSLAWHDASGPRADLAPVGSFALRRPRFSA